jgi:hypothetical protein
LRKGVAFKEAFYKEHFLIEAFQLPDCRVAIRKTTNNLTDMTRQLE